MGVDYAYFAAADDHAAVAVSSRPGGPLGWPVVVGTRKVGLFRKEPVTESLGPAAPGFTARGYDPIVTMGTLESLLRGIAYDSLERDPRWGGEPAGVDGLDQAAALVTVTDSLRDALVDASVERLREVAAPWSQTEELTQVGWEEVTLAEHVDFLSRLRHLAVTARAGGERLYCYAED